MCLKQGLFSFLYPIPRLAVDGYVEAFLFFRWADAHRESDEAKHFQLSERSLALRFISLTSITFVISNGIHARAMVNIDNYIKYT